ncbi:hypothetical protein LCGC14_0947120 [marine sediment metagenome]|uniref:Uncharacterized protein n=1 Tax=marine sediment metagenome TaxID=412755 RepID=A0A0F9RPR8_9ZZZZ
MTDINVSDINPAELLAGLYNASSVQGMGILQAQEGKMTKEEAEDLLVGKKIETDYEGYTFGKREEGEPAYFDYLHGKVMKVEINGQSLRTALYDRDNGTGAAQLVVDNIRTGQR